MYRGGSCPEAEVYFLVGCHLPPVFLRTTMPFWNAELEHGPHQAAHVVETPAWVVVASAVTTRCCLPPSVTS
jgi:hypothetical protein